MPNLTSRVEVAQETSYIYDRNLLQAAGPFLQHLLFAQVRDIPQKSGTPAIKFRRYELLSAATTPLNDGVTPMGQKMVTTDITATAYEYGDFTYPTDQIDIVSPDPIILEAGKVFGQQAGNTMDQLARDIYQGGTQVRYCGAITARNAVNAVIDVAQIEKSIRTLEVNNTMPITEFVNPNAGYATTPVAPCYISIVHPLTVYTLRGLTGFVPVEKYAQNGSVMPGEVGSYRQVRFIQSTNAKIFAGAGASSADVYSDLMFGANAFGVTKIGAIRSIVKAFGSGGTSDPLDQRASIGWKVFFTAAILNDAFVIRNEHTVAA